MWSTSVRPGRRQMAQGIAQISSLTDGEMDWRWIRFGICRSLVRGHIKAGAIRSRRRPEEIASPLLVVLPVPVTALLLPHLHDHLLALVVNLRLDSLPAELLHARLMHRRQQPVARGVHLLLVVGEHGVAVGLGLG